MATRGSHVHKTRSEQKSYIDNVVRGQDLTSTAPTTLVGEQGGATDSPMSSDDTTSQRKSTRRRSRREPGWLEQHKQHVVPALITLGGTVIAGAFGLTLITLNREVGQLQQATQDVGRQITELRSDVSRSEDRFERLRDRVEDLRDRLLPARTTEKRTR